MRGAFGPHRHARPPGFDTLERPAPSRDHAPSHRGLGGHAAQGGENATLIVEGVDETKANDALASLQRPDWHVRFDMDKEAAAATRRRVFDMVAAERIPFIGYHMPFPSVGFIETAGEGYRYVPASYQFEL